MQNKIISLIKFFLGIPLSIIALIFVFKVIFSNFSILLKVPVPNFFLIFLSLVFFIFYFFQRAYVWKKIISTKSEKKISLFETAYLWEASEIRRYVPGNFWSIISRVSSFSKDDLRKTTTLSLYALESIFIVIADLILSLFAINLIFSIYKSFSFISGIILVGTILICLILLGFLIKFRKTKKVAGFIKIFEGFGIKKNLDLFFNAIISEALFGVGSYFSVIAIFNFPVSKFLEISAFLIFARLIGFLSFVTPMGLGVREAIATAGFLKFLPASFAAITSIFSRIILIMGEVLFFGITMLLNKFKNTSEKIENFLSKYRYEILTGFLICCYILYFTVASFLRYKNFYTGRFDLGNMDQTVWNTIHGNIFQLTNPDGTNNVSRLSQHADFLLVLLAPFYLIWEDPRMLLLIQSIVIGLGAIFIFLIAKNTFKEKSISIAFVFSYLLYPAIGDSNLYDFHSDSLIPTFFLGAFYFLKKKKYIWMTIFLILAGLCKEEIWLLISIFGIYVIISKKKRILGGIISVLSLILFFLLFLVIIPHFHNGAHFAFSYYSDFGTTPSQILKTIVLSPNKTFSTLLAPDRLLYLSQLFMHVGFLSIFAPLYLIIPLPELLLNLLSTKPELHEIYYQYTGPITPFVFISFLNGVFYLKNKLKLPSNKLIATVIILLALISSYFFGPLPFDRNSNTDMFDKPLQDRDKIANFLSQIDKKYSIAASNNLGSHLSHRENIYTIPVGVEQADIVTFLLNDKYASPSLPAQKKMAADLEEDKNYIEIAKFDDFIVFKKKGIK